MILESGKTYFFIGKVENINSTDSEATLSLLLESKEKQPVKIKLENQKDYQLNKLYYFETIGMAREDKMICLVNKSQNIFEYFKTKEELENCLKKFYSFSPLEVEARQRRIEIYLKKIKNPVLKNIVYSIYNLHKRDFYFYPAATKFHHSYIGGLSYHTLLMLDMTIPYIKIYPYLSLDLLISGIFLHDMGKMSELSESYGAEYTLKGHLLGHLVLEANEITETAKSLGYQDSEEALLLEHMVISSHGNPLFGACKKPMIPEALLLWYFDTIDSKLTVIGEELEGTLPGEFTQPISVLDRSKMYKNKLKG